MCHIDTSNFGFPFRHIQEFGSWLKYKLSGIQQQFGSAKVFPEGRLGAAKVVFVADENDGNNLVKISKDKLTIQSQSAFCTLKANCCVYKGKWMYEVRVLSIFSAHPFSVNFILVSKLSFSFFVGSASIERCYANWMVLVQVHIHPGHRSWRYKK